MRTFSITTDAESGGSQCRYSDGYIEEGSCAGIPCPLPELTKVTTTTVAPIDCVGSWSDYSECTKSCGGGVQMRTFSITTQAEFGGRPCISDGYIEEGSCAGIP